MLLCRGPGIYRLSVVEVKASFRLKQRRKYKKKLWQRTMSHKLLSFKDISYLILCSGSMKSFSGPFVLCGELYVLSREHKNLRLDDHDEDGCARYEEPGFEAQE
jgi:hypothetical protein